MAVKAFVLIEAEAGKTGGVVEAVPKIEGVKSADAVAGPYDVVAVVEVADLVAVGNVVKQIHSLAGVRKTTTCIGMKFY